MQVVTVSTLGGGDIVIPFLDGIPITTGDLIRELATRVPNHRSTFLLCVNDAESPVEGHAPDADLATVVVDTTKYVTLLFETYEAFDTTTYHIPHTTYHIPHTTYAQAPPADTNRPVAAFIL
jgi:hypothetical protein